MRRRHSFCRSPRLFPAPRDFPAGMRGLARETRQGSRLLYPSHFSWFYRTALKVSPSIMLLGFTFLSPLRPSSFTLKSSQHTDMDEDLINNATSVTPTPSFPPGATCTTCDPTALLCLQSTRCWGRCGSLRGQKETFTINMQILFSQVSQKSSPCKDVNTEV